MARIAVVLLNLGGPDSLAATQPFLLNLFSDPSIINQPLPIRRFIAHLIAKRRVLIARTVYAYTKGYSPLTKETEAQRYALENMLQLSGLLGVRVFFAMRYWHPLIESVVRVVKDWCPQKVILLPLYPQFSTVTTGSALKEWERVAGNLREKTSAVCYWHIQQGWIFAIIDLIKQEVQTAYKAGYKNLRFIFSAHGLPESVLTYGDPYQHQIEETVAAIVVALQGLKFDYRVCYQSRIGLNRWIGPATRDIIRKAGDDCVPIMLIPISFVSEHIETLIELDVEYRHIAITSGVPAYFRVSTVRTHPYFVIGLVNLITSILEAEKG